MATPNKGKRIAELNALISAEEISIDNGATPQLDDAGNVKQDIATCGTCGKSWNDALITSRTPAPSGRCPYEYVHSEIAELAKLTRQVGRTKLARARKSLTKDELFFYENAGYSHDPKTETAEEGRIRCARELAKAEQYGRNLGFQFEWSDDWEVGSHKEYYGEGSAYEDREPNTCENCLLRDEDGNVLASLGCIDDADANYRRVIEAELAAEAMAEVDEEIDTLDAH